MTRRAPLQLPTPSASSRATSPRGNQAGECMPNVTMRMHMHYEAYMLASYLNAACAG